MTELIVIGIIALAMVASALILRHALQQISRSHEQLRERLPAAIAEAVATETTRQFKPAETALQNTAQKNAQVSEALVRTQQNLSQALVTLDGDGSLTEWVRGFQETSQPLVQAVRSVEHHYSTAEKLLESTSRLAAQCEAQRETVERSFSEFSSIVRNRSEKEELTLTRIAERMFDRLDSVSALSQRLADRFEEMQASEQNTLRAAESLSHSMQGLATRFGDLETINAQMQTRHADILRNQQKIQAEMQSSVVGLVQVETEARQTARQATEEINRQLTALRQERQAADKRQSEMTEKQREWISQFPATIRLLPSRQLQVTVAVLMGIQAILLLILIVRIHN
jgi:hypothetical protein